jgi:DNA-binding CsgD family transcriptional regulator
MGTRPDQLVRSRSRPPLARGGELALADRLLAAVRAGHGRLLVLEGPAGIGKTHLIEAFLARAGGFAVLRAAGSPLEQDCGFGLVRDLLEPRVGPIATMLAGEPGAASRRAVALTAELALGGPLLLAIDDLHWADDSSLRWLVHLCGRLSELPALVVLAWRAGQPGTAALGDLFRSFGERIPLAVLSETAVVQLRGAAAAGAQAEVAAEVSRRLAAYGAHASAFAQAVAVLGDQAQLRTAAALAGVELERGARLADELVAGGLLAAATPPAFADVVVSDAVYGAMARGHRALMHGAAARALAADGAPDPAVAMHLLRAEPADDASAVALLRGLAAQASSRGDPGSAVRLLQRALAEPPAAGERAAVLLELGLLEARAGLPGARDHLSQARRHGAFAQRGEAAVALADLDLLACRYREVPALLELELAGRSSATDDTALALRAELAACTVLAATPRPDGRRDAVSDQLGGSGPGARTLAALAAAGAALAGEPVAVTRALIERLAPAGPLRDGGSPPAASLVALWGLQTAEELPILERLIDQELQSARAVGSQGHESMALVLRARTRLMRGVLREAELDSRRALSLSRAHRLALPATLALSVLLESLVDQGRLTEAERELGLDDSAERGPDDFAHCQLVSARGRLRAAAGEAHLGMRDLLAAGARLLRCACATPSFSWRSRAGVLAHRLDRHDEALRLIDDEYALACRLGAPRPIGVALRAKALIASGGQIELLGESARQLRDSPATLDLARTLCDLGAALRRSNFRTPAREPLHEALQLAHECGADALAERARRELIVLGARPRRHAVTGIEALTAREREASELAACGLTNRQIAEVMSVTPNTVEYHLTNVFRKLGIANREGLAGELAPTGGQEP